MELTIPPLFRLPHPFRNRRDRDVQTPASTVTGATIPKPRTSGERTVDALVKRG